MYGIRIDLSKATVNRLGKPSFERPSRPLKKSRFLRTIGHYGLLLCGQQMRVTQRRQQWIGPAILTRFSQMNRSWSIRRRCLQIN